MTLLNRIRRFALHAVAPMLLGLLVAGCASGKKIDWNTRVGSYTMDQAILEFGPPDKQAELSDGSLVAEWETSRGYVVPGRPIMGRYRDPVFYSPEMTSPSRFLRLVFDKDKKLTDSKTFAK
jgi:hypothetical protein